MASVKYDVDMVSQQFSPVCWLACAAMLIQFKRRFTPSAEDLGMAAGADFRERNYSVIPGSGVSPDSLTSAPRAARRARCAAIGVPA